MTTPPPGGLVLSLTGPDPRGGAEPAFGRGRPGCASALHPVDAPNGGSRAAEIDASLACHATKDFRQGVAAFAARRAPFLQGR